MATVELFYFPTSFYSQRARLMLEEKGIKYKERIIMLPLSEQNQPWYLKLNPNGEVPALKIGDECFAESGRIMDVVDDLPSDCPSKLAPDQNTPKGQLVQAWREKLNKIPIPPLTYGVMHYPELSPEGLSSIPGALQPTKEGTRNRFESAISEFEKEKEKHPELKESYDRKIKCYKERLVTFFDKNAISQILTDVDAIMVDIERQLSQNAVKQAGESWLCGETFTAADIELVTLLGRFRLLGLLSRFADPKKHPALTAYWQRAQTRPSVQKVVVNNMIEAGRIMRHRQLHKYGKMAVGVGVVALAVWIAWKYRKN